MKRLFSASAAAAFVIAASAAPAMAQEPIGDSTFQPQEFYQPEQQEAPEIPTCADGEVLSFKNGQMICTDYIRFSQQAVNAENARAAENATTADRAAQSDYASHAGAADGLTGAVKYTPCKMAYDWNTENTGDANGKFVLGSAPYREFGVAQSYVDNQIHRDCASGYIYTYLCTSAGWVAGSEYVVSGGCGD